MGLPDGTLAAKDFDVGTATLLEVLAEIMEGVAALATPAGPRGELGRPGHRVAQADSICKGAKVSLLILALLAFLLSSFLGAMASVLGIRGRSPFGGVIVRDIGLRLTTWSTDEISGAVSKPGRSNGREKRNSSLLFDGRHALDSWPERSALLSSRGDIIGELHTLGGWLTVAIDSVDGPADFLLKFHSCILMVFTT